MPVEHEGEIFVRTEPRFTDDGDYVRVEVAGMCFVQPFCVFRATTTTQIHLVDAHDARERSKVVQHPACTGRMDKRPRH